MPSKPTPKAAAPPPTNLGVPRLPSLDNISSQLLAGTIEAPDPPAPAPAPAVFEPATDEPDEEEEDSLDLAPPEAAPAPVQAAAKSSRRGFLGAAAALVGGAAAAAVVQPASAQAAAQTAPAPPPVDIPAQPTAADLGAMMQNFMQIMAEREERLLAQVDARLAAIRPAEQQTVNVSGAEMAAPPGQYPTMYTNPLAQSAAEATARVEAQAIAARPSPRMVAFIPKEDPYNPRQTVFKTWLNGREMRAKRGQVMILTLGHGMDLAKNGHGTCVDIAAMQGIGTAAPLNIPQNPTFARPATWDGLPIPGQSPIPVMNGVA